MTPPTLRAIKCSERMPTREDANSWGNVVWIDDEDGYAMLGTFNRRPEFSRPEFMSHWFPLNRSAIATDAEEQT